ncbi:MAG: putative aminomethyltransferase protein, partial [Thermomicrobiales bacterium]|nr:putative aminomethyltransferase protein [Thermomicrobiales bacterium]
EYGIGSDRIPSPINWFMNVSIQQRGELEIREPLAEKDDYVVLRALKDVIAAVSACPQDLLPTNGSNPTDLAVRVYRDEPLPSLPGKGDQPASAERSGAAASPLAATNLTPRPARLRDTVEATVYRVETGEQG